MFVVNKEQSAYLISVFEPVHKNQSQMTVSALQGFLVSTS
jgi:hypothetical protein